MRRLLTWTDRSPGWRRNTRGDAGPIVRLITMGDVEYDAVTVLSTRATRAATRELVAELHSYVERVDLCVLDIPDPSDHRQLFEVVPPALTELEGDLDVVLSAGTPQAQTMWVILVQAGLLKARMLQVIPPQFVPHPHPNAVREVRLDIEGFPEIRSLREEVVRLRARVARVTDELIGASPPMRRLADRLARVAASTVPVLVHGETGTGKELVARAVHAASPRSKAPFVAENCGAFTEAALTSELFGHEPGAFTGATGRRRGLFEQADGGTLFLDEVAELTPATQVRLLRVLQEGTLRRMGAEEPIEVDVRVVAATHRDLDERVAAGAFREDLLYRLRGATLVVPPLRERVGDLEQLVVHFLGKSDRPELTLTRPAWAALLRYRWPGNVRELQAEVRRWAVFCDHQVDVSDLSSALQQSTPTAPVEAPAPTVPRTLAEAVLAVERQLILETLQREGGNLSKTARTLAIDRNTLKRKLERFSSPDE